MIKKTGNKITKTVNITKPNQRRKRENKSTDVSISHSITQSRITKRSGYYWCNSCDCNTTHIIFSSHHICLSCNLQCDFNNTKQNHIVQLFMI